MYRKGQKLIDKKMDVTKILQDINDARILLKQKFLTKTEMFAIEHNKRNLINIDSSSLSECCDTCEAEEDGSSINLDLV